MTMDNNVLAIFLSFYVDGIKDVVNFRLVNRHFNRFINNASTWTYVKPIQVEVNVDALIDNINNLHWYHDFIHMKLNKANLYIKLLIINDNDDIKS